MLRFCIALALAGVVSGCSGRTTAEPTEPTQLGREHQALQVCAGGPTVPGVDVSEWQGGIDWNAVAGSGIKWAYARINDGYHSDPYFAGNWAGMQGAGLIRGAYQFYEPTIDPTTQANIAIGAVGQLGGGDLPVMLDVEWTSGTPNAGDIQSWIDQVQAGTGKTPIIYTAEGYWNQYFNGQFGNIDLFVANYGVNCPNLPDSWSNWKMWQWGGSGVPGIGGSVDSDVFNGTLDDLNTYVNGITVDDCTYSEAKGCGNFGCGCQEHQCGGVFCPGKSCSPTRESQCAQFGCGCADGDCNGGFCPGQGCEVAETIACGKFGCGCVDHQCNGGFCAGGGCTPRETLDCGNYGCNCVDHQCGGGFCPGTGCTAKETNDCSAQGCGCVDHKCSGGSACQGSGCTAKEAHDCGAYGCGCVDHQCNGVFCPGSGCTPEETSACSATGCGCVDHKCSGGSCTGSGCTAREVLSCDSVDAGCEMGACVVNGASVGMPDSGVRLPDGGELPDGGIPPSVEPDGGWPQPGNGDAGAQPGQQPQDAGYTPSMHGTQTNPEAGIIKVHQHCGATGGETFSLLAGLAAVVLAGRRRRERMLP